MVKPMMTAVLRSALVASLIVACGGGGSGGPDGEASCTDGVDDDGDDAIDCLDVDCAEDPACQSFAEVCAGGVDEDLDGLADCEDDDCFGDPACYQVDDPTDLDEPLGDPAVDIDKIRATLAAGTATFFATFDAPWPPPTAAYSWFLYFEIDNDGNTPVAGVTIQRHDGVDSITPTGISAANLTVRQTARGVWVRMTGVPATGEKYYIESGIQETNPGTRVTDTVVSAPAPCPETAPSRSVARFPRGTWSRGDRVQCGELSRQESTAFCRRDSRGEACDYTHRIRD